MIGTQVTELIKAVKVCKGIFDAFFHQYDNAPARLRELSQLISTFEDILGQNEELLKRQNTAYPGHDAFELTLQECTHFLTTFKSLCDQKSHGAKKIPQAVLTIYYALEREQVTKLDQQLTRHALPMLLWNSNLILKFAFDRGEEPPVIQQPDLPLSEPLSEDQGAEDDGAQQAEAARNELDRFRKEMMELQTKMPRPLQRQERRTLYFQEIHDIVSRHWINLGFSAELLEVFSSGDEPEDAMSQIDSIQYSPSSAFSLTEINRCDVTITLDGYNPLRSFGYRIDENQQGESRAISWYDQQNNQLLKHHVPFGTHPHTYHADYENRYKVSFLQEHTISMGWTNHMAEPIYAFSKDPDCKAFQRFVRNRELLGTFDVDVIKCETGKLAELQQVKIWRLDGADDTPTISFYADRLDCYNGGSRSAPATFCELPLRCFERIPQHESSRVIKLVLNKHQLELEPQSPKRRYSLIGRRRSSSKASPTSPRPSIGPVFIDMLYDAGNASLITNNDWYSEMGYFDIDFTNSADTHRFIRTSRNAHPRTSFGSQLSVPINDNFSALMSGALPSQSQQSPPSFNRLSAGSFSIAGPSHYQPTSIYSTNAFTFSTEAVQGFSSAPASVLSQRSNSISMPPTPALTEQSIATSYTGATTPAMQIPSLPELQMSPSIFEEFEMYPFK